MAGGTKQDPPLDTALLAEFLAEDGLADNGSVPVYLEPEREGESGPPSDGRTHRLRSVAWRFLEDTGVGIAAFNQPTNRHCLLPNQQVETFLILEHARRDPRVKALVWTGTGTVAFNAGMPFKGDKKVHVDEDIVAAYLARQMAPRLGEDWILADETKAFWDFPKPVIMAINGVAVGGGANIALANYGDLVYCSTKARFMYPFARLGITPELGSSMILPFLVGMVKAKEMFMGGQWFSPEEALRLNLVNKVFPPEDLLAEAVREAARIGANHPEALRLSKLVINAPLRAQLDEVLEREQKTIMRSIKLSGGPMSPLANRASKL